MTFPLLIWMLVLIWWMLEKHEILSKKKQKNNQKWNKKNPLVSFTLFIFISALIRSETTLTMRKQAANTTALILTSRSMGNCTPKWSASVNISVSKPAHCLLILPITKASSRDVTYQGGHRKKEGKKRNDYVIGWASYTESREFIYSIYICVNSSFG